MAAAGHLIRVFNLSEIHAKPTLATGTLAQSSKTDLERSCGIVEGN